MFILSLQWHLARDETHQALNEQSVFEDDVLEANVQAHGSESHTVRASPLKLSISTITGHLGCSWYALFGRGGQGCDG